MKLLMTRLQSLVREEKAQDLIEYAMLVALIALACVVAINAASGSIQALFTAVAGAIPA